MADETKKKPAAKKEGKAEGGAEKAPKAAAEGAPAKAPKGKAAAAPSGDPAAVAPAAEAPKPAAEGVPAAAPTAAELLADDLAGKKIVKAKGAKNISIGIANILATFNNTLVSITDMEGHV